MKALLLSILMSMPIKHHEPKAASCSQQADWRVPLSFASTDASWTELLVASVLWTKTFQDCQAQKGTTK